MSWRKFKSAVPFKIFNELLFWSLIIFGYGVLSDMITAKDTIFNYIGFGLYLILLTFIINKLYNYYKQLKNKIK